MKKKRFTVERIVGILKQSEVGVPVRELVRKEGISEASVLPVEEAVCAGKKILKPPRRRQGVRYLRGGYEVSERRSCEVTGTHRSTVTICSGLYLCIGI